MSRLNWKKCNKPGASYNPKRQTALKMAKLEMVPATEKQISFLKSLHVEFPKNVTKRQAMSLISECLEQRKNPPQLQSVRK